MLTIGNAASTGGKEVAAALGANATSRVWVCNGPWMLVSLVGTWSSQTVTLQMSPGPSDTFATHAVKDATGTLTNQTFTANETAFYVAQGQRFKVSVSNAGSPSIDVYVSGPNIALEA